MLSVAIDLVYVMLLVAMLLALWRLLRGPSLADRVVALELISSLVVAAAGVYAIDTGVTSYLDVAIVMALTSFLAAIAFASLLERGGRRHD